MRIAELDDLVAEIVVDAYGDDEQHVAFHELFSSEVATPVVATVLGLTVEVIGFDYHDARHGVMATCRRDKVTHELGAADVIFPPDSTAAWVQAAYRRWLGLKPHKATIPSGWRPWQE